MTGWTQEQINIIISLWVKPLPASAYSDRMLMDVYPSKYGNRYWPIPIWRNKRQKKIMRMIFHDFPPRYPKTQNVIHGIQNPWIPSQLPSACCGSCWTSLRIAAPHKYRRGTRFSHRSRLLFQDWRAKRSILRFGGQHKVVKRHVCWFNTHSHYSRNITTISPVVI